MEWNFVVQNLTWEDIEMSRKATSVYCFDWNNLCRYERRILARQMIIYKIYKWEN